MVTTFLLPGPSKTRCPAQTLLQQLSTIDCNRYTGNSSGVTTLLELLNSLLGCSTVKGLEKGGFKHSWWGASTAAASGWSGRLLHLQCREYEQPQQVHNNQDDSLLDEEFRRRYLVSHDRPALEDCNEEDFEADLCEFLRCRQEPALAKAVTEHRITW